MTTLGRDNRAAFAIAVAITAAHLLLANVYGIFRDELYYLASAEHLAAGYVEHPPMIAFVAWLVRHTVGDAQWAVRLVPSLLAGVLVLLNAELAGVLGGGRTARTLVALATALMPFNLAIFSVLSMNAIDFVAWSAATLIAARALREDDPRWWPWFGLTVGLALLDTLSIGFLVMGLLTGLAVTRRKRLLLTWKAPLAAVLALALVSPFLVWQAQHGWPFREFADNATRLKNVSLSVPAFLREQLLAGSIGMPLVLPGLAALLLAGWAKPFRALGVGFLVVLTVMLSTNAKPYYLAPAYGALLAAGAVTIERASQTRRWLSWAVGVVTATLGVLLAPLARPVLPVETFVRYAQALGVSGSSGERARQGPLPQFYADRFGWDALAQTVAGVVQKLPPGEREQVCVFGQNYGEAGAIDFYRERYGLPPALSGHNSYWYWGTGTCTGQVMIVIGGDREGMDAAYEEVEEAAVHRAPLAMPYESELVIYLGRRLKRPIAEVWPQTRHLI